MLVSLYIQGEIETLDAYCKELEKDDEDGTHDNFSGFFRPFKKARGLTLPPSDKYYLGTLQKEAITLAQIKEKNVNDLAFSNFQKKLTIFINNYINVNKISLPPNISYLRLATDKEVRCLFFCA